MRTLQPAKPFDQNLLASNVGETGPAAYRKATTYASGDQVTFQPTYLLFPGALPSGAAVARSTPATRRNSTGAIESVAANLPRYDFSYDATVYNGLLLEEAAKAWCLQSENFGSATWTKGAGVTVTSANLLAPNGTAVGDTITFPGTGIGVSQSMSPALGRVETGVYAKAGTIAGAILRDANHDFTLTFDAATGQVTSFYANPSTTVIAYGVDPAKNGWFYGWVIFAATGVATVDVRGTAAGTLGLWGATCNAVSALANKPGSYISTTTAAVDRAQDVLTIDFGALGVPNGTAYFRITDGNSANPGTTIYQAINAPVSGGILTLTAALLSDFSTGGARAYVYRVDWIKYELAADGSDNIFGIYTSLQASSTGHAVTDPAWWSFSRPTNRWAMFDNLNGTQTSGNPNIDVTVRATGVLDSIALLNLEGASVRITLSDDVAGIYYDQTFRMQSNVGIANWYDYYRTEIIYQRDLIVTGLPIFVAPKVRIRITNNNGSSRVGSMIFGKSRYLGATLSGASMGIQDYSRKDVDDFGNYTLVVRDFSRRGSFRIVVEAGMVDEFYRTLSSYRATPILYIMSDNYGLTAVFGFYRDFNVEVSYLTHAVCSLELEGLNQ